ncbi:polysaccharide deacetylase family protein [Azohydromonas caseinilytica]|uniref:Polysaccharide deacetylase family protein n=1 Tax=Azohydromonas caseinilytica TaxID=2728836 RepID=A0A848FGR6_9BURK|nr:polysaccharide deacetylase family protein [Azohydromonas caseinilytica]NML18534.1 polysaccharide deacetylase family protein [Azohydromonas caseinilytica]
MTFSSTTPWSMPPLLRATFGLHAAAAGALLLRPEWAGWAIGTLVLNHAALTAAGLWPRSRWLGPNLVRLPPASAARGEVALTIDDGPDPVVTPAVLDLLERHGARATFFCIAQHARRHPALVREIVARGHSVQNHSDVHRHNFSLLGPRGFLREIERAQQTLTELSGERPTCFRAPAGLRNPFLDPVLHRLGLRLASWTRRGFDTRERDPARVLQRLVRGLAAGDILLLHDGNAARTAQGRPVVLEVLPPLLERCRQAGLRCVTLPQALRAGLPAPPSANAPLLHADASRPS